MGRLTLELDDDLIESAREALGTRTKRETIVVALQEARQRRARERMLEHAGKVELGISAEELLALRRRP